MGPRRTNRQPIAGISFGTPAGIAASSAVGAPAAGAAVAADGIADASSAGGALPPEAAAAGGGGLPVDLLQGQPSALVLPENVNWSQLLTDVSARVLACVPLPRRCYYQRCT